jgi:uncharacterized protein (AIM24 family)
MSRHSLQDFVNQHLDQDQNTGVFELEDKATLQINLAGLVYAKAGSMIAYRGNVKFSRKGALEDGLTSFIKKAVTGEGATLMKMEGNGRVYLADKNKRIHILQLAGESICVNGNDLLAMESELKSDITMMKSIAGALAGGLFNVKVQGSGLVAITTHGDPLVLPVTRAGGAVFTDPNATVAWSGNLSPNMHTDVSFGTLIGRTSGESVQMKFEGDGWVMVQPFEEEPVMSAKG